MSHDQKPAKLRLTTNSGSAGLIPPARRRGDVVVDHAAGPASPGGAVMATGTQAGAVRGGPGRLILSSLFLLGCAAGGVTLPLLGWM